MTNDLFICEYQYPLHPDHNKFPKLSLMCHMLYNCHITCCSLLSVAESVGHITYGLPEAMCYHTWYKHQCSSSYIFYFLPLFFYAFKTQNINIGQHTLHGFYPHINHQTQNLSSLRFTGFLTCRPYDPDTLLFSDFNSNESPHMKRWMVRLS